MLKLVKGSPGAVLVMGLSTSAFGAASGAGELGGTVARDTTPAHFYGYNIGSVNLNSALRAQGLVRTLSAGGSYHIGFFRGANSYAAGGGHRDMIGLYVDEGFSIWPIVYRSDTSSSYSPAPVYELPFGPSAPTVPFSMSYDPSANGGTGALALNLNGTLYTHNLPGGIKNQLQNFTHFGILGYALDGASGTRYWDDFTFSTFNSSGGSQWTVNGDGDWFVAGNWSTPVPNAIDAVAVFGSGGSFTETFDNNTDSTWDRLNNRTAPQNYGWSNTDNTGNVVTPPAIPSTGKLIYAQNAITVGTLRLNDAGTCLLDGAGSLTLQVSTGAALVEVEQGAHKINLPLTIASDTTFNVAVGATLRISDPMTVNAGRNVTQTGTGTVLYESMVSVLGGGSVQFGNSSHMASLTLASNANAMIKQNGTIALKIDNLNVAGGRIDLKDNKVITANPAGTWNGTSAYTGVAGLVDAARGNAGNAMWDGPTGIGTTDTRAINNGDLVSIGVALVSDIRNVALTATTTFAGHTVLGSDTIAMVTWGGDANLDGKTNIDDYGRIDGNVGQSGSVFGWSRGDFNYDGKINIDDYGIIDGNINRQGTAFSVADGIPSVSAVPEPALIGLMSVALLAGRRRRRYK